MAGNLIRNQIGSKTFYKFDDSDVELINNGYDLIFIQKEKEKNGR